MTTSVDKRDYYELLEIDRNADADQIKKAYRKLAVRFHPDKNPGDASAEEKFKEGTEAYEVLKDPEKRRVYDQFGHQGLSGAGAGPGGFGTAGFDLSDALRAFMRDFGGGGGAGGGIFDELFGGGGRQRGRGGPVGGADLKVRLKLTIEEIASGTEKKLRIKRMIPCETCSGSGAAKGAGKTTCIQCAGAGEVRQISRSVFGQFVNITTCPRCHGSGQIIEKPCESCNGDGRTKGSSTVDVKIPAGVSSGNYLTVQGAGHAGPHGGPAGDAIVLIEEAAHEQFERHGDDLLLQLPISFAQAALGDAVIIPTLNGSVKLKIPHGTQSGRLFRLRGKGIPHLRGFGAGDQLVRVIVWTPTDLSKDEKNLFAKLGEEKHGKAPKGDRSFFDKLRSHFGG